MVDLAELAPVSISDIDGRRLLTMTWALPGTLERVWHLLVSPDDLARWAPYTSDRRLDAPGPATIVMMDGDEEFTLDATVVEALAPGDGAAAYRPLRAESAPPEEPIALEPPPHAVLRYSWGADVIEWALIEDVSDRHRTWVTMRQWLADPDMTAGVAAGWHLCLTVADALVTGHPVPPIRGQQARSHGWEDLNLLYADTLGIAPTPIR